MLKFSPDLCPPCRGTGLRQARKMPEESPVKDQTVVTKEKKTQSCDKHQKQEHSLRVPAKAKRLRQWLMTDSLDRLFNRMIPHATLPCKTQNITRAAPRGRWETCFHSQKYKSWHLEGGADTIHGSSMFLLPSCVFGVATVRERQAYACDHGF